jgi:sulfatase modifying factor 1
MFRATGAVALLVVMGLCSNLAAQATNKTEKIEDDSRVITNSIGMKLVLIPAGEFQMGSRESAEELAKAYQSYGAPPAAAFQGEYPLHRVRITKPFYLGVHEVTVGQFRQFVTATGYKTDAEKGTMRKGAFGWNPDKKKLELDETYSWRELGFEQTDDHPVVNVSWNDAVAFCEWLSRKEGKTYRLPTEAEWEYACRAGTATRYYHGDDPEGLAQVGNVADATAKETFPDWEFPIAARDGYAFTAPVGKFKPNAFGLYDMHGNALEWCADWYAADYYKASPSEDPKGPDSGTNRVLRGGSWSDSPVDSRSAFRNRDVPAYRIDDNGFRLARTP